MGWSLFKPKPFLAPEDEAWHLETWAWLLRSWGGAEDIGRSPLVTPSAEFFPPSQAVGHERALHLFDLVKKHARMQGWACRLEAQPEKPPAQVSRYVFLESGGGALGTFGAAGNGALITYDPALLKDPTALVATFAHELAHYRLSATPGSPPGGAEMEEYATDLATLYLGFGLFGANSAFNFRQHADFMSQGWSWSRKGYLSERDWVFSLAVFFGLTERAPAEAKPWLKPHLFSDFRKAFSSLEGRPELLEPVRAASSGPATPVAEAAGQSAG
jgi:hypothetical protein